MATQAAVQSREKTRLGEKPHLEKRENEIRVLPRIEGGEGPMDLPENPGLGLPFCGEGRHEPGDSGGNLDSIKIRSKRGERMNDLGQVQPREKARFLFEQHKPRIAIGLQGRAKRISRPAGAFRHGFEPPPRCRKEGDEFIRLPQALASYNDGFCRY